MPICANNSLATKSSNLEKEEEEEEEKKNAGPKTSMNEEFVEGSAARWATMTQVVRATLTASFQR
jgi:hypothetical protein